MLRLPQFEYVLPRDLSEAVKIKGQFPEESMFVAGGTDVVPKMKRRQFTPKYLIFIRKLKELKGIKFSQNKLTIGSAETLTSVKSDKLVCGKFPAISDAANQIATVIIQNMGTIGGNILLDTRCTYYDQNYFWRKSINFCLKKDGGTCWVAPSSPKCVANASSDLAPVLIALDAKIKLLSSKGERVISLSDIYNNDGINYLKVRSDEILTQIILDWDEDRKCFYKKLRRREAFDFPALGVACSVKMNGGYKDLKFVLTGCGSSPISVSFGDHKTLDKQLVNDIKEQLYSAGKPLDNTDFNMTWRKHMIKECTEELITNL